MRQDEYEEWNSLVESSPQGTIFHKTSWLGSIEGYQCQIIVCTYKKSMVCGIPLPFTKRYGIKFAVNPPLTPYLGVVFRECDQKYTKKLSFEKKLSRLMAESMKDFAHYMEYSFHYNFVDAQPFIWSGFSVKPNYTYVLNLDEDLETILGNMSKDTRNRIATASKYDIKLLDATPNEIVELVLLTYGRKNQKLPYPKQTYEECLGIFSKNKAVKAIVAKDNNDLLAGGAIVYDGKRAYYLVGGVNPRSEYSGIGQLTIWNLIRYAKDTLGLEEFDFEGSMNENIEKFFRGFGGKLTQHHTVYKNNTLHYLTTLALQIRTEIARAQEVKPSASRP